jgi:hypothetical protein
VGELPDVGFKGGHFQYAALSGNIHRTPPRGSSMSPV